MSPIDSILGLPGVVIQRVERKKSIHVWARPSERPSCLHCANDSLRIKSTHNRTLKHTRQANQIMILHLSVPKYHCKACNRYFRHRFAGIRPRLRATESYRLEVFEAHDGGVTQRKLSMTHRIGSARSKRKSRSSPSSPLSSPTTASCATGARANTSPRNSASSLKSPWTRI